MKNKLFENAIFILTIFVSYNYEKFSGLQEILIFSFLIIVSKYFFLLNKSNQVWYVFFIVLVCNLIIWFKSEGIVYATILILLLNFSTQIPKKIKIYSSLFYFSIIIFKIIIYKYFDFILNAQPYYLNYIMNLNFTIVTKL